MICGGGGSRMAEFEDLTTEHIPDLLQKFRRPADLKLLFDEIIDSGRIPTEDLRLGKGIVKQLREEVVPLYSFGLEMERGSIGSGQPMLVRQIIGNQSFDAGVRPVDGNCETVVRIEITVAKIDGHQDALGDEHRAVHGRSSPFAHYSRDHRRQVVESSPAIARTRCEIEQEIFSAVRDAVARKARKQYPTSTWMLCWLDEYCPAGLSEAARQSIVSMLFEYRCSFQHIVVMGFATTPIVIS